MQYSASFVRSFWRSRTLSPHCSSPGPRRAGGKGVLLGPARADEVRPDDQFPVCLGDRVEFLEFHCLLARARPPVRIFHVVQLRPNSGTVSDLSTPRPRAPQEHLLSSHGATAQHDAFPTFISRSATPETPASSVPRPRNHPVVGRRPPRCSSSFRSV